MANQIANPYAWEVIGGDGTGGRDGSIIVRAGLLYFGQRTFTGYLQAEYGKIGTLEPFTPPQFALPLIVGGKPRAMPMQFASPYPPPPDIG